MNTDKTAAHDDRLTDRQLRQVAGGVNPSRLETPVSGLMRSSVDHFEEIVKQPACGTQGSTSTGASSHNFLNIIKIR